MNASTDEVQEDRRKGHPYMTEEQLEHIVEEAAERAADKVARTVDHKIGIATKNLAQEAAEIGSEIAIKKATERIFITVGRTVVEKTFIILGVVAVAAIIYLQSKGYFIDVDK